MAQLRLFKRIKGPQIQQNVSVVCNRHLKTTYGISLAEYERLLAGQSGKCAACGSINTVYGGRTHESMCVDHDHKTGKIRGLLCHKCNRTLGNTGDRPELLRKLADYLEHA